MVTRITLNSVMLALAAAPIAGLAQQAEVTGTQARGLEEVIVTAQRREQNLQDVALSVSALGSAQLERADVTEMTDLVGQVPSLVASPGLTGGRAMPVFAIRGSEPAGSDDAGGPVGDDLLQRRAGAALAGIEHVVLRHRERRSCSRDRRARCSAATRRAARFSFARRNLRIRSRRPSSQMIGNYGAMETQAMLNVPFGDWGALRIAGQHNESDGWLTDVITGKEVNFVDEDAGRISFDLHPSERWNSLFTASYSKARSGGTGGYITALPGLVSRGLRALQTPLLAAQQQRDHFETASGVPMANDIEVSSVDNTTTIELTDRVSIKNIVALS